MQSFIFVSDLASEKTQFDEMFRFFLSNKAILALGLGLGLKTNLQICFMKVWMCQLKTTTKIV
jgi:hypothetical protein